MAILLSCQGASPFINLIIEQGIILKSKNNKNGFKKVYVCFQLSEEGNQLLSEACQRSGRKKIPEAALRLEDHLRRFRSISELNHTIPNENTDVPHDDDTHS